MNPRLLVPMIDGITTVMGRSFIGVVDPNGVIYYIDGEDYGKNNRSVVSCGGSFLKKSRGYNHFVDTTNVLETRFDDYQYYQDMGA